MTHLNYTSTRLGMSLAALVALPLVLTGCMSDGHASADNSMPPAEAESPPLVTADEAQIEAQANIDESNEDQTYAALKASIEQDLAAMDG
ncbi:hypothetical protein [Engelhardtia mirabilis]|uniref:Secreted protein n=1 Tax=Engelhardtia mirabilis TaxID=2528011 RepID=A0A518BS64_9BACT|nr:hypothetical protein Pla133_49270 [Planctomycetes bacterium Pla133]QDV04131.1 hypothetical protein Pla86_49250 [Planctomycetes bacterium Pla86]